MNFVFFSERGGEKRKFTGFFLPGKFFLLLIDDDYEEFFSGKKNFEKVFFSEKISGLFPWIFFRLSNT